jgi:ABC-type molybdate transport system substrate-binding protein
VQALEGQIAEDIMCTGSKIIALAAAGCLSVLIAGSAAVPAKAKDPEGAKALAKFLSSEAAVTVMKQKGMDPG